MLMAFELSKKDGANCNPIFTFRCYLFGNK